jgi:hypothetical protein
MWAECRDLAEGDGQTAVVRMSIGLIWVLTWIVLGTMCGGESVSGERIMVSVDSLDLNGDEFREGDIVGWLFSPCYCYDCIGET